MFPTGDSRIDEILLLAEEAIGTGLLDKHRQRWRELVQELLGSIRDASDGQVPERRRQLRAAAELEVDLLAPEEIASLATSTVGAGGVSIVMDEELPIGTPIDMSIKVAQRTVPLLLKGQVVWCKPGEVGVVFIDAFQNDRELLEGIAVKATLEGSKSG